MVATEPLTSRPLGPDDAAAAFTLSTEAGWNQTVADWQFMLEAGEAQGQLTSAGDLVASALILPYGDRIAWIGMVLTTRNRRRRGLATENLRWATLRCAARGLIAGLDATPAGREVYAPLGFADDFGLQRLAAAGPDLAEPGHPVRPMRTSDLPAASALDAQAFGAERLALLEYLFTGQPGWAWVATRDDRLAGFVLGRAGRATSHLGPLIARDPEIATALAARALAQMPPPVSIDVPDDQSAFRARLLAAGFAPVRPFTRMLRHAGPAPGAPALTFAIAGPELG